MTRWTSIFTIFRRCAVFRNSRHCLWAPRPLGSPPPPPPHRWLTNSSRRLVNIVLGWSAVEAAGKRIHALIIARYPYFGTDNAP